MKKPKYVLKFERGDKLTFKQAILNKCFDCMGNYADGKRDCVMSECSLYQFMPYGAVWRGRVRGIRPKISDRMAVLRAKKGIKEGSQG